MVSVVVAKSLGKLHYPIRKEEIPLREEDDISLY